MKLFTIALFALLTAVVGAHAAAPTVTNIAQFPSVSVHYTNYAAESIITNGLTLGGVRNTAWPSGGTAMSVSNNVASAGLLAVDATKTNGIAATLVHITNAMGIFTGDATKAVSGAGTLVSYLPAPTQLTLTHAGTLTLDFTARQTEAMLNSITGAITLATSNLGASNSFVIFGRNTQATNCPLTTPAWQWMQGSPPPITAQRSFVIKLESRSTMDTNVFAWYYESQ